ncbi:MAG: diphthine synthase [Acidilobus sp.]
MLTLVGAGLGPKSVTPAARRALEQADLVIVDSYTSPGSQWLLDVVAPLGKKVIVASRAMLEEGSAQVIDMARTSNVALVVAGDPLVATTHSSLVIEARSRGVDVKIVPGLSGPLTSISASGLQFYRFGRKVTIPGPWRGVKATSVAYWALGNLCLDLHTLLLLDVSPEGGQLPPPQAVNILREELVQLVKDEWKGLGDLLVLTISVTDDGASVSYSTLSRPEGLATITPSSLILPSRLHPMEAEFLRLVYGVPVELIRQHDSALREVDPCTLFLKARRLVLG